MDNRPLAGRVRAPSRPLPTDQWDCVVDSPDFNPFLPRVLWTVDGYKGIMMLDPDLDALRKWGEKWGEGRS
jgi:hypothetical protein